MLDALEAGQYFGRVNVVRVAFGVATFMVPLATLRYTTDLAAAVAGLALARVVATGVYAMMCLNVLGDDASPIAPRKSIARQLLRFGAWITVSNIVGPLMVTFDRFVIAAVISVTMVTYYATPSQISMQFLVIPTAFATVLFPAFATAFAHAPSRLPTLFREGVKTSLFLVYPGVVLVVAFAPEILEGWVGGTFPARSSATLRWLMLGVLANGVAQFPFALIQSVGRSDLTAKVHLAELPLYLLALYIAAKRFGIDGVALVWFLRSAADLALLTLIAFDFVRPAPKEKQSWLAIAVGLTVPLGVFALMTSFRWKVVIAIAFLFAFAWQTWRRGRTEVFSGRRSFRTPTVDAYGSPDPGRPGRLGKKCSWATEDTAKQTRANTTITCRSNSSLAVQC